MRAIETVQLHEECLGEAIDAAAARWGDAIGWVFEDREVSFNAMRDGTDAAARALIADGVGEGDVVALWMPNRLEFAHVQFACARIGAVAVSINESLRGVSMAGSGSERPAKAAAAAGNPASSGGEPRRRAALSSAATDPCWPDRPSSS